MFTRESSDHHECDERRSFLDKSDFSEVIQLQARNWSPRRLIIVSVCGVLIYTVALIWALMLWLGPQENGQGLIYSPASSALRYEAKAFDMNPQIENSSAWVYAGPPSPALDDAWGKLMKHSVFRITDEEMHALGREAEGVRFTDGSGYLGQLTVFHNLHCIKRIHQSLNLEYYYPNITSQDYQYLQVHNAHCLNMLRQAIMCQGDASPITMKWGETQPIPLANSASPHQCVDWDTLNIWAEERKVDVYQPGLVVHPTLGPSYTKLNNLGVVVDTGRQ